MPGNRKVKVDPAPKKSFRSVRLRLRKALKRAKPGKRKTARLAR